MLEHFLSPTNGCFLALSVLVVSGASASAGPRGLPPREGISNFGRVSQELYRGAQPDAAAIANLHRLGIKTIIDLRNGNEVWKGELEAARAHGIIYTNLPMRGVGRPRNDRVLMVLGTIDANSGPVFVHCEHGCDRTGTIIACYRIKHDNWSSKAALQEAARYGMSRWERGMKRYVEDFAKAWRAQAGTKDRIVVGKE